MNASTTKLRQAFALTGFILITFTAPLAAVSYMPDAWYAALMKPSWNPPAWLFGPVWTTLYTLMAVAAWLVWRRIGFSRSLGLYLAQLVLNAAWTPLFFGAHQLGWALIEILVMWVMILRTLLSFRRVNPTAGWLFLPYLAWVSFAAFLNFTLWRLNPA
jgi:tryptophan-rich sensory protein